MPMYIDADLITDETAVAEAILAGLADKIDSALGLDEDEGWEPSEGSPETSLAEAVGIVLATAASLVQETERQDYEGFGSLILNTPRLEAEPAIGYTTWAFTAAGAYFIPDGSELVLDTADGTPVGFATVGDIFASGLSATDVQVVAIEPGAEGNELSGPARDFEPLPFVSGVEMTTPTSGGRDAQTRDEYLESIVRRARRMKIVPIVTDDYADTALDHPSVARAVAVRLLDLDNPPASGDPDSPGHVTVFPIDVAGQPVASGVKAEVEALMEGDDRPLSVEVHIGDPTYTDITLAVTIRLALGADHDATVQAVQDALTLEFDPARYNLDETAPGRWRPPTTDVERTITAFDVSAAIDDVPGVQAVTAATVNGGASVELTGYAPLPNLTDVPAVTVV